MKDPLGVIPSKGNQGTTRGIEKKSFDLVGRRQSNGRSNPEVVSSIPTEVKIFFLCLVWFPDSLY